MVSTIFSGTNDLILIAVALVVLFGGSQLPKLARNLGEAAREIRKAKPDPGAAGGAPVPPPSAAPVAEPAPALPGAPAVAPAPVERITLTRAELDALLKDREARARAEAPARAD